jgi:hypothetical protein
MSHLTSDYTPYTVLRISPLQSSHRICNKVAADFHQWQAVCGIGPGGVNTEVVREEETLNSLILTTHETSLSGQSQGCDSYAGTLSLAYFCDHRM